ncbi:MAG: TSUP family transporter, partial [Gemmatimonadota bacterium]
ASIGVIAFAAPAGILTYAVAGWAVTGLPPGTMGYVHVPAGLAMLPGAILCARYGAQLNQRVNVVLLRRMFAVLLVVLGLRLIWVNAGGFPG